MQRGKRLTIIAILSVIIASLGGTIAAAKSDVMTMTTPLSGDEEVPAVDTHARGVAIIKLNQDGDLTYKLNVANIENVLQSHIHVAPADANGPVVAFLYPDGPPPVLIPGRFGGTLASGTITDADLVGPLAGGTVEDLLDEIRAGTAYVNVHTVQNPGGEIRGQIPGNHGPASH
jgi:hypothetical protein